MDKNEELQKWLNDDRYVRPKELIKIWEIASSLVHATIKPLLPVKIIKRNYFYSKLECEKLRPFVKKTDLFNEMLNNKEFVSIDDLMADWGMTRSAASALIHRHNLKSVKILNLDRGQKKAFYYRKECEAVRLLYMNLKLESEQWANDEKYIQIRQLASKYETSINFVHKHLARHGVKPIKTINAGNGMLVFYNKADCEKACDNKDFFLFTKTNLELSLISNDNRYVMMKELTDTWGISRAAVKRRLDAQNILPIKTIKFNNARIYHFYDRAECERARPFINQPEQKEVEKVENIGELATATKYQILSESGADDFVWDKVTMKNKIMPVKNYCDERGNFVSLFKKDETVSAILAYKNEQKQLLEKCLADKNLVTTKELVKIWNLDKSAVYNKIYRLKIKPYAKIKLDNGNMWHFYKKSDCIEFYQQINNTGASNECLSLVESDKYNPDNHATMKDLMKFTGKSRYMIMQRFINKGITPISKPLIGKTVSYVYDLQESLTVLSDILKPQYRKLIASETKEIKTMGKKQMELPEPKEQTPDIIPADTIDLFTMPELEIEFNKRGVELTAEVRAKINASDMPEMQHIATMLRGNAKSIAIRLSVLNEIAGQLAGEIKNISEEKTGLFIGALFKNCTDSSFYLDKELKPCPFCGMNSIVIDCEEISTGYWVARLQCSNCEVKLELDDSTKEIAADLLINQWNERPRDEDFAKTKAGAKSKYKPEFDEIAFNMASANKTDEEIAQNLKISMDTFYRYKREIPSFADALNSGRAANPFIITDSQGREKADRYFELKDFMEMQKQLNDMQKMIEKLVKKLDGVNMTEKKMFIKNGKIDKVVVTETKLEGKNNAKTSQTL